MNDAARTPVHPPVIVVAPASGTTGSRVVRRLAEAGATVRGVSRSTSPAFDWTDPTGWPAAFAGADGAYLAFVPDLAVPGSAEVLSAVGVAARDAGVGRLVLLSGRGEAEAAAAEDALRGAGLPTAVLRADWFAQNFTEGFLAQLTVDGVLALPVTDVREPFVDVEDLAEAAATVLLAPEPIDATFELSGPESLTFAEAVAVVGAASGTPVVFRSVSSAEFDAALAHHGVPDDARRLFGYLFTEVLDGRNSTPTDGVRRLLGRAPRGVADVAGRR